LAVRFTFSTSATAGLRGLALREDRTEIRIEVASRIKLHMQPLLKVFPAA
jgi:hypothetical protein